MRKLVPSRSWRFILGITAVLIGLGSLAYSQLADDSSDESPPLVPGSALPPLPGEAEDASVGEGSDAPVKNLREDFATARRALARARQARSESDRRSKAELDRMRKDLERSKEELRLAQRAFSVGDPNRATKLSSLQDQVDKALVKLKAREQGLSREEAFAARKLQSLEEELGASEAILADALAEVATPGEALPAVSLLQENLNHTHNDIVSSLNDSARNEQDVLAVAQGLGSTLEAARQELAAVREIALREGRSKELETVDPSGSPESELKTVTDFQLEESARLRPEIGELDITRPPSNDTIRQLQEKVDASEGLQASLNEDVEKLRTELKQAFRKIISMQMKLEESDLLVNDLERQKNSLMQSKKEGVSGVEGMNRMMERLEKELATAKTELSQAHDSLNAEKVKSAAVISNQTAELQRTKMELERVKVLAKVEGRDATSMLKLEEELNRTKAQLLTLQRQNIESGAGTADIKAELKSAFGEIMKLKAELAGKEDLKQQLANLEKSLAGNDVANASPERLNELIRNLNASKLALQQARADQENVRSTLSIQVAGLEDELQQSHDALDRAKADITRKELDFSSLVKRLEKIQQAQENQKNVRRSLSEVVAGLEDELQQSRDNLDLAQVEMARKELEFSDLVKGLESELAGTYKVIRQTTNAHTQGSDVIEIMDADLGAAQTRMQQITDVMEKERLDAAKHIRDLQLELQTVRLRQESILDEVREKDQNIAAKDDKLQRVVGRNAKLEEQLKEVEAMSHTLTELNSVLRSTETVQNSNVDQANALVNHLRDELEQAKVEALLAKQSKGDLERRSEVRVNALEKQLNDTQNQLELVKGQFHDMTGEGAALIAELRGNLRQAEAEITLLKQAGAGETVGTEKLAAQLQEALGAIQVLQHNLNESEKVNAEVDDLRLRLATAMEANIGEKERDEAETVVLRKKMRTLEMELAMAQQAQSEVRVTGNQLFSNLKDELEASRAKVAAMQARLGQSEDSSVGTIADLEEQLARSKAEKMEIEQRMHNLLQGKTQSVDALEQQLVLTKKRIDELEQLTQGAEPNQTRITSLEQQLVATKAQLDDLNEQRNAGEVGSIRAAELEKQLTNTQNRLNELLVAAQQEKPGHPPSSAVVAQLQTQLNDARSALDLLQGTLIQRDKENNEIEAELEKALENMMDMQMSAGGGNLRRELDALKKQLAEAKAIGPSPAPVDSTAMAALELEISKLKSQLEQARQNQVADQTAAMAALELEITKLKSELEQARQNQAVDQTADLATLQLEIDQLKKDLQQAAQGNSTSSGTAAVRLKGELETATETIVDLQTQLAASKKQLQDMNDLETARASGDEATTIALSNKLEEAMNAIRVLKDDIAKSEALIAKREEDASKLDNELEESFQAMLKLKNERDVLAEEKNTLNEQVTGLEDLNAKLTAANNATQQASEADNRLKRERDDLLRSNLVIRTDLDKYKNEVRRLQESLAAPRPAVGNAANMQAQITSLESQLQVAKTSEGTVRGDFDRVSAQLKDAMRQVMVLETNLGQTEGRLKQLENVAGSGIASRVETSPQHPLPESSATRSLRDEVLRLRAELEAAQAAGSSRSQTEDRLRDTSQKLLAAQMELERSNQRIVILDDQANKVEARRRSDVEREKAANQMVSLLNEKLKREEAKNLALQEGIRKARVVIASLRGEPGASPNESSISSRRRPSMFDDSPRPRSASFTPRPTSATPRSRFDTPPSTFSGVQPRQVPSRSSAGEGRFRPNRSPSVSEGFTYRPSSPVGRTVNRGTAKVDFEVVVQFLDKTIKPASNVEFFLTQTGIEDITAGAGIRLPNGVNSAAEFWARSIHRGYSYPGMAAKIRDSLSQAAVARFKTNSSGSARLSNLPVGRYVIIGAAPMGAIGVVWSQPIDVSDGTKVRLDLRNVAFAK